MKKIILAILGVLILAGTGWFYYQQNYVSIPPLQEPEIDQVHNVDNPEGVGVDEEPVIPGDGVVSDTPVITFDGSSFSPNELTIFVGETVVFQNNSDTEMWPASAIHPTHTVYPGSNIAKCGTEEEGDIFDACGGVEPGGNWSFVFNEAGEWGYHDHLRPSAFGRIIVVEAE